MMQIKSTLKNYHIFDTLVEANLPVILYKLKVYLI